jgi:hypothetical protein
MRRHALARGGDIIILRYSGNSGIPAARIADFFEKPTLLHPAGFFPPREKKIAGKMPALQIPAPRVRAFPPGAHPPIRRSAFPGYFLRKVS